MPEETLPGSGEGRAAHARGGAVYVQDAPGVLVRSPAAGRSPVPDLFVFDIDGVLIDTAESYPATVEAAALWFCRERLGRAVQASPVRAADLAAWKAAGGFNDDWQLAAGVCLYLTWHHRRGEWPPDPVRHGAFCGALRDRGGGLAAARALCSGADAAGGPWDPDAIARVCMERYGGDEACEAMFGHRPAGPVGTGLWRRERGLVGAADLEPWRGRLGIYTGRNAAEAEFGLRAAGLHGLFPREVRQTTDSGHRKPDPGGLVALAAAWAPRLLLFTGDTPDDAEAVLRYRRVAGPLPPALFAGVLGGAAGDAAEGVFRTAGADIIAADTASLLRWLRGCR